MQRERGRDPKSCRKQGAVDWRVPDWNTPRVPLKRGQPGRDSASQTPKERRVESRLIVAVRDEQLHGEIHLKLTRRWLHFMDLPR